VFTPPDKYWYRNSYGKPNDAAPPGESETPNAIPRGHPGGKLGIELSVAVVVVEVVDVAAELDAALLHGGDASSDARTTTAASAQTPSSIRLPRRFFFSNR
jgi:hypothetical protein